MKAKQPKVIPFAKPTKAKPEPKPASKDLTTEEVIDRAKKWARLHRNQNTRSRMDECLAGISNADQRRVYLCGQRIATGLPIKVVPAANQEKGVEANDTNRSTKNRKGRQPNESH